MLFHQGDVGDALYVLLSGTLEVSIVSSEGKKLSLNMLKAGEIFGEIGALDGKERTATVAARDECRLIRIHRDSIAQLVRHHPEFAAELLSVLCSRIRWISRQVEDLAMLNAESRLANRLLLLHERFADGDEVLHISQSELSEFLGTSRETVNKTLQSWRARKLHRVGTWLGALDRTRCFEGDCCALTIDRDPAASFPITE